MYSKRALIKQLILTIRTKSSPWLLGKQLITDHTKIKQINEKLNQQDTVDLGRSPFLEKKKQLLIM